MELAKNFPPYALSRDTFLCIHGSHVIFLNLRGNRYFALEYSQFAHLETFVQGWPPSSSVVGRAHAIDIDLAQTTIQTLLQRDLIELNVADTVRSTPLVAPTATDEWIADRLHGKPKMGVRELFHVLRAVAIAKASLKYRPVSHIMAALKERKTRADMEGSHTEDSEIERLVSVFDYLRPYVLSATNGCLLDSLTLLNFLAEYRLFPNLVFGVRTGPFLAHCWLQRENIVLNDTVERVCRFTPIMTV